MMPVEINALRDYYKLYDIMRRQDKADIELCINKTFLEPKEVLMLVGFIISQIQLGNAIQLVAKSEQVRDYVNSIGLPDFCNKNHEQAITINAIPKYTAMPIKRLVKDKMHEYINATRNYFRLFSPGKDLGMLDLALSELLNNAFDHSHSQLGAYVFCQYYPATELIKLAVSDFGIGIPHSVNSYMLGQNRPILLAIDAVKWAVKENMTTKSVPQNMGKGLDNLKTFMSSTGNSWELYTNEALLNGYPSNNRYRDNPIPHFKGTLAQINIRISTLNNLEEQDLDWNF
jgi:hypothetical protein